MSNKLYQVDAFTSVPFKGNPAGVMFLEEEISEERMQQIAAEMNLSETAFLVWNGNRYVIRYFTPTVEIPLCGHATLAAGHLLYELDIVPTSDSIYISAKGGELVLTSVDRMVSMDFPVFHYKAISIPEGMRQLVGFDPIAAYQFKSWLVLEANSEEDILQSPNISEMVRQNNGHIITTAKGAESDFVLRCFAPDSGIDEDPVTGSIHCGLVPIWADKLNKNHMHSRQLSERGGDLYVNILDNRVSIKGHAVTVMQIELKC